MSTVEDRSIFSVKPDSWFVKTINGVEGPLPSREDAQRYLDLLAVVSAARGVATKKKLINPPIPTLKTSMIQ